MDIIIWVLIGFILIFIEVVLLPNMGILFCGFSAVTVALMIFLHPFNLMDATGLQVVLFLFFTIIWSCLIWYPLRVFLGYSAEDEHRMIIGSLAVMQSDVSKDNTGILNLGGKEIKCQIDPESTTETIKEKAHVKVTNIVDNIYWIRLASDDLQKT